MVIEVVELFCGAGGLSHGLQSSGMLIVAGSDYEKRAKFAFENNHKGAPYHLRDIRKLCHKEVASWYSEGSTRLLAGGVPCQPFSELVSNAHSGRSDKRTLLNEFLRIIKGVRPHVVLLENVPGIINKGGHVFKPFVEVLAHLGFTVVFGVLNAKNYQVPQSRERLILIASRIGSLHLPAPSALPLKTLRDAIEGLPPLTNGGRDAQDPMHRVGKLGALSMRRIRATPHDGGDRSTWPTEITPVRFQGKPMFFRRALTRARWDSPYCTVLCNHSFTSVWNGGHPVQDRSLSLRELARCQSFPDSFTFWGADLKGSQGAIGRLIGNAVPPLLAKAIGDAIISQINA